MQGILMENFQHSGIPYFNSFCRSDHIPLIKGNILNHRAYKDLNPGYATPWRPPFYHSFWAAHSHYSIGPILPHDRIRIPGHMVSNNMPRGGIIIPEPLLIIRGKQEVKGQVLQSQGKVKLVKLYASVIVDERAWLLSQGVHLVVVEKFCVEDLFLEVNLVQQLLLSPVYCWGVPQGTCQQEGRAVLWVSAGVAA